MDTPTTCGEMIRSDSTVGALMVRVNMKTKSTASSLALRIEWSVSISGKTLNPITLNQKVSTVPAWQEMKRQEEERRQEEAR